MKTKTAALTLASKPDPDLEIEDPPEGQGPPQGVTGELGKPSLPLPQESVPKRRRRGKAKEKPEVEGFDIDGLKQLILLPQEILAQHYHNPAITMPDQKAEILAKALDRWFVVRFPEIADKWSPDIQLILVLAAVGGTEYLRVKALLDVPKRIEA